MINDAVFDLIAPSDLLYFDGHFRDMPILARCGSDRLGDCALAGDALICHLSFRAIHALKFQRVIPPELPITLELVHDR